MATFSANARPIDAQGMKFESAQTQKEITRHAIEKKCSVSSQHKTQDFTRQALPEDERSIQGSVCVSRTKTNSHCSL
jgi:hypothetical protein